MKYDKDDDDDDDENPPAQALLRYKILTEFSF